VPVRLVANCIRDGIVFNLFVCLGRLRSCVVMSTKHGEWEFGRRQKGLKSVSSTPMDVDPSSVSGETELTAYMRVQQLSNDTDPLMWWKQHQQEFPRLAAMTRQNLAVPATSASPETLLKCWAREE
jgi:hypothetical protein